MLTTSDDAFAGFGRSKFISRRAVGAMELVPDYAEVRSQLRAACPVVPGVYGMIDCVGRLVYVGVSRCLRKRTLTYFQESGDPRRKESRVAIRAKRLVWETSGHELLALLREQELIRRFAPQMNIRDRRGPRLAYVFLSVEEAPRFKVGAQLPQSCRHYWGPVVRNRQLLRATDALNRHFLLPDCKPDVRMWYGGEPRLFELALYPLCLRGEVNRCLAPCAGAVSHADYVAQLQRARGFLNSRDDTPLLAIDRSLAVAVSARRFEQAAALRDLRHDLVSLRDRLSPRTDLLPTSFVYEITRRGRSCWLAVHEGTVVKVATAPHDPRTVTEWRARFEHWLATPQPLSDEREGGELQILAAWFRRRPAEVARVMDFEAARGGM